jgi:hypothetical protein
MDEIGRGTSTFDGLALASGIATHLHDKTRAFTLFATHYFELTEFPAKHHGAVNVHVSAESGHDIVFLHEIQPGPASRSYGIQVARLAGMPAAVVNHARHALAALESQQAAEPASRWTCSRRRQRRRRPGRPARWSRAGRDRPRRAEPARSAGSPVRPEEAAPASTLMTYCVGIKLNAGLVFLSDSRTNAGVDNISTFRKMIVYEKPGDRFMVLLSAGNLSISQSVREILQVEQLKEREDERPHHHLERHQHVRRRARAGQRRCAMCMTATPPRSSRRGWSSTSTADLRRPDPRRGHAPVPGLFGRQLHRGHARDALLPDRRVQVRQARAGPRAHARDRLDEAAKCALVSMDSTLKSNLSVGLPLDLVVYEADRFQSDKVVCIDSRTPTSACCTRAGARSCARCSTAWRHPVSRPEEKLGATGQSRM